MLSAAARGLGTCWIGLGSYIKDPETLKEIGLTADHVIVAPIIIGYPMEIPEPPEKKETDILKVIKG